MGQFLKRLLKHKKRMLLLVIILLIIALLVVFSAAKYLITIDEGTLNEKNPKNVPGVVSRFIKKSALNGKLNPENMDKNNKNKEVKTKKSKSGGYALDVDLDQLTDEIITELNQKGGSLNVYFSKGKLHEYLKKMIKAEYITQYPDLRSVDQIGTKVDPNEFQGVIKFIRHYSDGTEKTLEYIPLGEEKVTNNTTMYGLINQANGKDGVSSAVIQNARDKILNYFSIDINGNLIIAKTTRTVTKTSSGSYGTGYVSDGEEMDYSEIDRQYINSATENVTYEYKAHIINYKSIISRYTMPFNYLWDFLVCGEDQEFVKELADLVLDSQIDISIYDNLTEIEEETINAYNDNTWQSFRVSKRTLVDGSEESSSIGEWSEPEVVDTTHDYQIDYKKTYTDTVVVTPTKIDIWYMKYTTKYTYEVEDKGEEKEITRLPEEDLTDVIFHEGEWNTVNVENLPVFGITNLITGYTFIEEQEKTDFNIQNKANQCTLTGFYHTIKYKYTLEGDPIVKEKTDPKLKKGQEGYPNFCTLYLESKAARRNLYRNESWLFTVLENNEDTVNLVVLTKYLIYCATGRNLGVTSFDFSIVYPTSPILKLYGGTSAEQVWFALLDLGYSKEAAAGVLGNLQQESGLITNNVQNSYESSLGMNDEAYTNAVDSGTYTNFAWDSAGYGLAQWTSSGRKLGLYEFAKSRGTSISDPTTQIEYLLGEISPTGGADGYAIFQMAGERSGYTYATWQNASTPEEAAVAFCKVFERAGDEVLQQRMAYARGFYEQFMNLTKSDISIGSIPLTGENQEKMSSMLTDAVRIANDDRYIYSNADRYGEYAYDCSSLVYRLYGEHFGITLPVTTDGYSSYNSYNIGSPSSVELQPGDVLWKEGHVIMYIGNGNYVAANTDEIPQADQISVYQDTPSNFQYVYRFVGS